MKRLLLILFVIVSCSVYAQDTISVTNNETDSVVGKYEEQQVTVNTVPIEKYNSVIQELSQLKQKNCALSEDLAKTSSQLKDAVTHANAVDTMLFRIASNFLYIPYEAYSVKKIAIPAYRKITNQDIKEKCEIRGNLLEKYPEHIQAIMEFFSKIRLQSLPGETNCGRLAERFREQQFYKDYLQYKDWKKTFLGKIFVELEHRFNTSKREDLKLDDIKLKLETCLATEKDL